MDTLCDTSPLRTYRLTDQLDTKSSSRIVSVTAGIEGLSEINDFLLTLSRPICIKRPRIQKAIHYISYPLVVIDKSLGTGKIQCLISSEQRVMHSATKV